MFVKNVWYIAASESELEQPFIARRILNTPVIMFATSTGQLSAMEDACPHRLVPLSRGKRVNDEIRCGYHGMCFSAEGECTHVPGQTNIPSAARVKTFPLILRHGFAWIWMGDKELADPNLVPDIHWNNSPEWASSRGYHHVEANFRLLNDNLLDLSHETYVHEDTIGNDEAESIANYTATVTVEANCLTRAHREMPNIDAPPFFAMSLNRDTKINRWQSAINLVPSINLTIVGFHPVDEERSEALIGHVLHLLTPETETSTHYFWAFVRNYNIQDQAMTETVRNAIAATFDQDKVLLEIQQKQIEERAEQVPRVAIKLDQAPIQARRLLEQRLEHEAANPTHVIAPPRLVPEHSFALLEEV